MAKSLPTLMFLNSLLRCEPVVGKLYWRSRPVGMFSDDAVRTAEQVARSWNTRFAGKEAFTQVLPTGYLSGHFKGDRYYAHRLIWKMTFGEDPDQIDHINGIRVDNLVDNMRDVSCQENHRNEGFRRNNTSGVLGVSWSKVANKWVAQIRDGNRKRNLGYFDCIYSAAAARKAAELELGFHVGHGARLAHRRTSNDQ